MTATKWSKFFWSDWESDEALRQCSLAAQGLWMRMLCVCAKGDGYLVVARTPLDIDGIAKVVGGHSGMLEPLIAELEKWGVFSRDRRGCIYCRRMLREDKRRIDGSKSAADGKIEGSRRSRQEAKRKAKSEPPPQVVTGAVNEPPPHPMESSISHKPERKNDATARANPDLTIPPEIDRKLWALKDEILDLCEGPSTLHGGRIDVWLANGATPDEIRTVVRGAMARDPPPDIRSLNYFDQPIADAIAARTKPLPEGKAHAPGARQTGVSAAVRSLASEG